MTTIVVEYKCYILALKVCTKLKILFLKNRKKKKKKKHTHTFEEGR